MKSLVTRLLVLAVSLFCCMMTAAYAQQVGETPLQRNEKLKITLTGAPPNDMQSMASQEYNISDAGTISLQYLKSEVRAVGLTPSELARHLVVAYKNAGIYTNPTFNVTRLQDPTTLLSITVSGEVKLPGSVVYRPGIRLLDAISEKGGFDTFANPKNVRLMRGTTFKEYDLRDISKNPQNNVVLQPGDTVIVRQSGGIFKN